MSRPKLPRRIRCKPCCTCFKPEGGSEVTLNGIKIQKDEFEALKLHDKDGLDQKEAARKMGISQSTFARVLAGARKKVSQALVDGQEIKLV